MKILLFNIILAGLLCSCSEPAELVKLEDICFAQNKNKLITTEGTIYLYSKFSTVGARMKIGIRDGKSKLRMPTLLVYASSEKSKNSMRYLNDNYTNDDFQLFDDNGNTIKLGQRVRVTGTIKGSSQAWCDMMVDKIEKITP